MKFEELLATLSDGSVALDPSAQAMAGFEFDDDLVSVMRVERDGGSEAVEISAFVSELPPLDDPDVVQTLRVLNQINAEGLLHHGWLIASDEDRMVILRRLVPLEGLDRAQLEAWVGQAMERAGALRNLLESIAQTPVAAANPSDLDSLAHTMSIKG